MTTDRTKDRGDAMTTTQTAQLVPAADPKRAGRLSGRIARRIRIVLAAAFVVVGILASAAGPASATNVSWPALGGTHDQNVYCDAYGHRLTVTVFAAPMWYHHNGQVVQAIVYVKDTRVTQWTIYNNYPVVDKVMPNYLGSAILGASGTEADWEYPMRTLGSFSVPVLAGHAYQVYVYYTYYNDARQVVASDMHPTSSYTSGYWGYSGRVWIPTSSAVSCNG